ncbi:hypothetical protein V8D89_008722 [Ganoderma adspersum]
MHGLLAILVMAPLFVLAAYGAPVQPHKKLYVMVARWLSAMVTVPTSRPSRPLNGECSMNLVEFDALADDLVRIERCGGRDHLERGDRIPNKNLMLQTCLVVDTCGKLPLNESERDSVVWWHYTMALEPQLASRENAGPGHATQSVHRPSRRLTSIGLNILNHAGSGDWMLAWRYLLPSGVAASPAA